MDNETALLTFLTDRRQSWRGLLVEPVHPGEDIRLSWTPDTGTAVDTQPSQTAARPARSTSDANRYGRLATAVAAALPDSARLPLVIHLLRSPDDSVWADSVDVAFHRDPVLLRGFIRDQAGLPQLAAVS